MVAAQASGGTDADGQRRRTVNPATTRQDHDRRSVTELAFPYLLALRLLARELEVRRDAIDGLRRVDAEFVGLARSRSRGSGRSGDEPADRDYEGQGKAAS